jgi:hypothetical protein
MEGEDYTVQEATGGPRSHNTAPQRPVEGFRGRSRAAPVAVLHQDRSRYSDALVVLRLSRFESLTIH